MTLLLALLLLSAAEPAPKLPPALPPTVLRPPAEPPVCTSASHDRLKVQSARDVCAPALSAAGVRVAAGFLPTQCRRKGDTLKIDAVGERDACLPAAASS
jgi:hypothetical protein